VQATITTVAPVPSTIAVYGFPSNLPADGNSYPAIVVQLQDSSGSPAKAPIGNVVVTLSSSNAALVGSVDSNVVIQAGSTYATANFRTVPSTAANYTVITAMCSGYSTGQTTINTQPPGSSPYRLALYLGPPKVPADGTIYNQVLIQLQDSSGRATQSNTTTTIMLSSSATDIGGIQPTATILPGETSTTVEFNSTYKSGSTMITAAATNLASAQQSVTTVGPVPSKLAVYCTPSSLPADDQSYGAIVVQLQDSSGTPAYDPIGSVTAYLFSSKPDAGNVNSTLTIPFGSTYGTGNFSTTYLADTTTITAQGSGYDPGEASVTTYVIDQSTLSVNVIASPEVAPCASAVNITAYVSIKGSTPAVGATVQFQSDNGGTFSPTTELGNGYYAGTFTTPNFSSTINCTITATASETGYNNGQGTTQVEVNTAKVGAAQPGLGEIQLQVKDEGGSPINNVSILSLKSSNSTTVLGGISNQTGYVTFLNAASGNYTFTFTKPSYTQQNMTIQLAQGQFIYQTVVLSKTAQNLSDTTELLIIASIIIVVVIAAILSVFMLRRHGRSSEEGFLDESPNFANQGTWTKITQEVFTNGK
jgi:hypothetical protein